VGEKLRGWKTGKISEFFAERGRINWRTGPLGNRRAETVETESFVGGRNLIRSAVT